MREGVVIHLYPKSGKYKDLADVCQKMTDEVRRFPGIVQTELLLAPSREEMSVFQIWESSEAYNDYLIWRSKQKDLDRVFALSSKEPDFRTYQIE